MSRLGGHRKPVRKEVIPWAKDDNKTTPRRCGDQLGAEARVAGSIAGSIPARGVSVDRRRPAGHGSPSVIPGARSGRQCVDSRFRFGILKGDARAGGPVVPQ